MLKSCVVSLLGVFPVCVSSALSNETRESIVDEVVLPEVIKVVRVTGVFSLLVCFCVVDLSFVKSAVVLPKQVFVNSQFAQLIDGSWSPALRQESKCTG